MKKFNWNGTTIELDSTTFTDIEWNRYMVGDWLPEVRFTGFYRVVDKMKKSLDLLLF